MKTTRLLLLLCLVLASAFANEKPTDKKIVVSVRSLFAVNEGSRSSTVDALVRLMKEDPQIEVRQWGGISLPSAGDSNLLMSLAGKTSPDIGIALFHTIRNDIKQNFLYPLNEWIGDDLNGDGEVSGDEVKWKEWEKYKPLWRAVASQNGKIYGIPVPSVNIQGMVFRIDLVKEAGLDPNKPPKDWDEFYEWCKALTMPNKVVKGAVNSYGQRALCLPTGGYMFLPWIYTAGGEPFIQYRKSPKTGKEYGFSIVEEKFITPEGEDLSHEPSDWRANWDTEEGRAALSFWYKLRWGTFEKDGEQIKGVVLPTSISRQHYFHDFLGTGEVAMMAATIDDLAQIAKGAQLDPSLLSWFPYPAAPGPKGRQCVQIFQHYCGMYANVKDRPKEERDKVWKALVACIEGKMPAETWRNVCSAAWRVSCRQTGCANMASKSISRTCPK
ncbi:MAG: extracellular solute-binding protein [Victivallales bacterium]|nr:extracellular solute-binding protein [Victivallales bacterium]